MSETRISRVASGGSLAVIGKQNVVLYWGLNESGSKEANALKRVVGKSSKFIPGHYEQVDGRWRVPGIEMELQTREDVQRFVEQSVAEQDRLARLVDLLMQVAAGSRDISCKLVSMCAEVERNAYTPRRMVISAHASNSRAGFSLMSAINADDIVITSLQRLTDEFPSMAKMKHLMISGCASGAPTVITVFLSLFPNLETIWAYTKSSPNPNTGSIEHIIEWERQTRPVGVKSLNRKLATGPRAPNVATWSKTRGYDGQTRPIEVVRSEVFALASVYNRAFVGDLPESEQVKLRQYYWAVYELRGHKDLPASERLTLGEKVDKALLLRFYPVVQRNFASHYAAELRAGYSELGRIMPSFASMKRRETFQEIFELERIRTPGPAASRAIEKLTKELRDLNMPPRWIEQGVR